VVRKSQAESETTNIENAQAATLRRIEIPRVSSAGIMGVILLRFSAPKKPESDELSGLLSENECGRRGRKREQIQRGRLLRTHRVDADQAGADEHEHRAREDRRLHRPVVDLQVRRVGCRLGEVAVDEDRGRGEPLLTTPWLQQRFSHLDKLLHSRGTGNQ
jgi:hypothetical protein